MGKQEKSQFNEQIRERTIKMAVGIHQLLVNMKVSPITRPIINQLIRSSSSVASNYRAATRSRSDAEFYAKICIVVEEIDETQFWLDYLCRIDLLDKNTDLAAEIAGDYSFTTTSSITVLPSHEPKDTIIYFSGCIVRGSSNYVVITYAEPSLSFPNLYVPGVIYPKINEEGIFSYPDFINTSSHPFFEGKVMDDGTIKISFGEGSLGANWGNFITGKRR